MYYDVYEKRGYPIGCFIVRLIILMIIVFIINWQLPKYLSPNTSHEDLECTSTNCNATNGKVLTSQLFNDNLRQMKESAISYFTDEKLSQEVTQYRKMSLAEMIDLGIITPLIDKNNNMVDTESSYIKISKENDEYILKVKLKDSEAEDYILVHLGCYSYCDSYICEKSLEHILDARSQVSSTTPIKGTMRDGIYYAPNDYLPIYTPTDTTSSRTCTYDSYLGVFFDDRGKKTYKLKFLKDCLKPICKKISNYYFDRNGDIVSYTKYKNSCKSGYNEDIHICDIVDGSYYDKMGNRVSYEKFRENCDIQSSENSKRICNNIDGEYYDTKGNKVSKQKYIRDCEHPICEKISEYYFGLDGEPVVESQFYKECGIPTLLDNSKQSNDKNLLYEYSKTTGAEFSTWTNWSTWSKTNCETTAINCSDNDITCLNKIQLYKKKEKIGSYEKSYVSQRHQMVQLDSKTKKVCSNYDFVEIDGNLYISSKTYSIINNVTSDTAKTVGDWIYKGRDSYSKSPSDSKTNRYVLVGADYSYCGETCTTLPRYFYDSYSYTGILEDVDETTVYEPTNTMLETDCDNFVTKTIPVYKTILASEKVTRTEPLYGDVCYQSSKSRDLIKEGVTKYKWSNSYDLTLLNNGWNYTGRMKSIKD